MQFDSNQQILACVYASLILFDDDMDITTEHIDKLLKISNINVDSYLVQLFCNLIDQVGINGLILSSLSNKMVTSTPDDKTQASIIKNDFTILVIGKQSRGEFGLGHANAVKELTNFTNIHRDKSITHVYSGSSHTIFTNKDHSKYWKAGNLTGTVYIPDLNFNIMNQLTPIQYFNDLGININTVCSNSTGMAAFFITKNKGLVYCVGGNCDGLLGLGHTNHCTKVQLIPDLEGVVDIVSGCSHAVALCATNKDVGLFVSKVWTRLYGMDEFPNDIINIIIMFYYMTKVYSTNEFGHKELDFDDWNNPPPSMTWRAINHFENKNIIKIAAGFRRNFFLESNGTVWGCSYGYDAKYLGILEVNDNIFIPQPIKYFVERGIVITNIKCGGYHNLAVDANGRVYGWGYNVEGQCGVGSTESIKIPTLIEFLKHYEISDIDCGYWHSYCGTTDGMHFLFGKSEDNECITENDESIVTIPHCINGVIEKKYRNKRIKSVSLGFQSTVVILTTKAFSP